MLLLIRQIQRQLGHHIILKVHAMVCDKLLRDTKSGDNLIEYEIRDCLTVVFYCRHCLIPFCELIDSHNDMMVPPSRI